MLYLAMSCLQDLPMQRATEELLRLEVDGIQLTPGNAPTRGFRVGGNTVQILFSPDSIAWA